MFNVSLIPGSRRSHCISFLLLTAAICAQAQSPVPEVSITAGTIVSESQSGPYGGQMGSIVIQGPNLSLNCSAPTAGSGAINVNFGTQPAGQTIAFNPMGSITTSSAGANCVVTYGDSSADAITYNSSIVVNLNFVGLPTTATNISQAGGGSYVGSVSDWPFSMSGTVSFYTPQTAGANLVTVPISGYGLFSAFAQGDTSNPNSVSLGTTVYSFCSGSPGAFCQAPSPTPLVHGLDTTTQGAWNGHYGGEGYMIANGANSLPSYAAVTVTGDVPYTWASQTSDIRAMQNGAGSLSGIASAFTQSPASNFTINCNLTDGATHRVALYLLDWDTTTRVETITITDTATNTVLDTKTFSSFHSGQYAIWNLKGNLVITVSATGGGAVVSGIFFGPPGAPSAPPGGLGGNSATYTGVDTTTQGTWTGKFGNAGYVIANGTSNPPAFATTTVTGDITYTWAGLTSDVRALQLSPGSTGRLAATYTADPGASFSININITDGKAHPVALYLLDWDTTTRAQTITILDATTNTILDTESYSGFANGQYAIWNIKGSVIINVTPTSGVSAVVSGIFFN
jgi:hypothetical protein